MASGGPPDICRVTSAAEFTHTDHDAAIEGKLPYASFQKVVCSLQIEDLAEHSKVIAMMVAKFRENWDRGLGGESFMEDAFLRKQLKSCIFVGHVNTDLDSVACAVCAAELFGGIAARSEANFNGEIACALEYSGLAAPPDFRDVPGGAAPDANGSLRSVCLVDHNEVDQMTPALREDPKRMKRIVGLIDHHAIASSFMTTSPLRFSDVRSWGSAASIVFHLFLRNRVPVRKEVARLLLCAVLSDTLNLKSGTTTPADRFCVAVLAHLGEVEDVTDLALRLFTAKTTWIVGLGAYEMVRGDQKNFIAGDVRWSIAVLEVTDMEPVLKVAENILTQLRIFKYECGDYMDPESHEKLHTTTKECHCALLFVVDTVNQRAVALICGARERWLAKQAFPGAEWRAAAEGIRTPSERITPEETLCDVGGLCSRKLQFLPMCSDALAKGVPEWYKANSPSMERLNKVLQSDKIKPPVSDSVRMIWDEAMLKAAVFYSDHDAALLMDILSEG